METSKALKALLTSAGLTLVLIGVWINLAPVGFYGANGILVEGNSNLLNELRAPAGLLVVLGSFIFAGAYMPTLTASALLLSSVVYLSYAMTRVLGFMLDGLPSQGLMVAATVEGVLGFLSLWAWYQRRARHDHTAALA